MTHGREGYLDAYDSSYKVEELQEHFTADKCRSLAGKPKIFLIQVRGFDFSLSKFVIAIIEWDGIGIARDKCT